MNLPKLIACLALGLSLTLTACSKTSEQPSAEAAPVTANLPKFEGQATVEINTNKGKIVVELDGANAPISVGNFVDLTNRKFFDGLTFHRVEPGFVIQGGDPLGNGNGGFIDPQTQQERDIPLEIRSVGKDGKPGDFVYGKTFDRASMQKPPVLNHRRGVIAMARASSPNSASSQFYITLADVPSLDGSYAVFGKVTKGMEVVDQISVGDKMLTVKVISTVAPAPAASTPATTTQSTPAMSSQSTP
ncbi:MAG: peptidylprolyl isomerase [Anaerolineae bacterium]|nr:peptidylprolyl isomerase [Gloeobacterales cyanobacterium ES-bin-313]